MAGERGGIEAAIFRRDRSCSSGVLGVDFVPPAAINGIEQQSQGVFVLISLGMGDTSTPMAKVGGEKVWGWADSNLMEADIESLGKEPALTFWNPCSFRFLRRCRLGHKRVWGEGAKDKGNGDKSENYVLTKQEEHQEDGL